MTQAIKSSGLTILFIVLVLFLYAFSSHNKSTDLKLVSGNILVVGFNQNFNSNHYTKSMIAAKMGIGIELMDTLANSLFIREMESVKNSRLNFIYPYGDQAYMKLLEQMSYSGEEDEKYTDFSGVNVEDLNQLLTRYNSKYLICFSQYFLKRQEKPFPTLFHIINYTIYNQNKEEMIKGKVFTNTFDLINLSKFESLQKKNARKYIMSIEKELN